MSSQVKKSGQFQLRDKKHQYFSIVSLPEDSVIDHVVVYTVVDQNKIGQSKFRLCNSIFLRNPSLRKQKCQK
jgi:hypothetical protein